MGRVIKIPIPNDINVVALPAAFVRLKQIEQNVYVVVKEIPRVKFTYCGAKTWVSLEFPYFIRGGVRAPRKFKYGEVNESGHANGYLVFERFSENEFKLVDKEPDAFIYYEYYGVYGKREVARYEIRETDALRSYTDASVCARYSEAGFVLLCRVPLCKVKYVKWENGEIPTEYYQRIMLTPEGIKKEPIMEEEIL